MAPRKTRSQNRVNRTGKAPKILPENKFNSGRGGAREGAGRPSSYNTQIAAEICSTIATSTRSITLICQDNQRFPHPPTIYRWMIEHEEFRNAYRTARLDQTVVIEQELLAIADTPKVGEITTQGIRDGKKTAEIRKVDMIEHRRLQIETRRWLLSKLRPREYGERIEVDDGRDPLADLADQFAKRYEEVKGNEPADKEEETNE